MYSVVLATAAFFLAAPAPDPQTRAAQDIETAEIYLRAVTEAWQQIGETQLSKISRRFPAGAAENRIWIRFDFSSPQRINALTYDQQVSLYELDCEANRLRLLDRQYLRNGGAVSSTLPVQDWSGASPGTVSYLIVTDGCALWDLKRATQR